MPTLLILKHECFDMLYIFLFTSIMQGCIRNFFFKHLPFFQFSLLLIIHLSGNKNNFDFIFSVQITSWIRNPFIIYCVTFSRFIQSNDCNFFNVILNNYHTLAPCDIPVKLLFFSFTTKIKSVPVISIY